MVRMIVVVRRSIVAGVAPGGPPVEHRATVRDVLVPLDGSAEAERALPVASALAAEVGADLRLLTAADDLHGDPPSAYLEQVAGRIDGGRVDTDVALDQEPVDAIVERARDAGTVVCMATHARGRLASALHPDVSAAVVAAAAGPVLLIGPDCPATEIGPGPVLVAHDGTPEQTQACRPLVELAAALRRAVHVVRVAAAPSGHTDDHPYAATEAAIAPLLEVAEAAGVHAEQRVVFGTDVDRALLAEAARIDASLIAMAMHRRTRLERFRQGSTTMQVAHDATVPVLARHHDADVA